MSYPELLQERYREDPWKLLVCCILLNQTTRRQVDKVLEQGFFSEFPDASAMAAAQPSRVERAIKSLGLWHRRANTLVKFSAQYEDWLYENGAHPSSQYIRNFYGCGLYAQDSYRMFVSGVMSRPISGDKELMAYFRRQHGQGQEEQAHPQDRGSDGDEGREAREGTVPGALDA